ncbi:MAG: hypothetical protein ACI9TH_001663 [Kiritimatiellia bacterium]|jgi:hypothetical protein
MVQDAKKNVFRASEKMDWERHEAKYVVHPEQVAPIREFLKDYCIADPNGTGPFPEYTVTTLQLDDPRLTLYHAKEEEALSRFKLRVRTYGTVRGTNKVYLEIKRKIKNVVAKSRATVPSQLWGRDLLATYGPLINFKSSGERECFYEFIRVTNEINAGPRCLIRYVRESYFGANDRYARVTFDKNIQYRPTREWDLWPQGGRWWQIDSEMGMNRPFSGMILELKTYDEAPVWMIDLVKQFNLTRVGFCKYAGAMRMELLFAGGEFTEASDTTQYT